MAGYEQFDTLLYDKITLEASFAGGLPGKKR